MMKGEFVSLCLIVCVAQVGLEPLFLLFPLTKYVGSICTVGCLQLTIIAQPVIFP